MSTKRHFSFTTNSIPKHALPPEPDSKAKDIIYWDDHRDSPPGFGIRVGKAREGGRVTRTFVVQRDLPGGKTKRVSLGRWLDDVSLDDARTKAREVREDLKEGRDPAAADLMRKAGGVTLRDAFERHLRGMEVLAAKGKRQPRSIADMKGDMERYFAAWLDRPLHTFSRPELDLFHAETTEKRGPYAANRACRAFRAAWNSMARLHEALPVCPTKGIVQWNDEERVGKPIAWEVLPAFWRTIDGIKNPIRADLVRVLMLTGLRSLDARTIRWTDLVGLDGDEPTLHRPNPKGGPRKAFTLPVSRAVAEVFRRRREENAVLFPGSDLVFPTIDRSGRGVTHVKNAEEDSLHGFGYTPHRARDTFATACEEAGVTVLATKLLLNHHDKSMTEGYQRPSMGYLRDAAEKVAAFLLGKAGVAAEAA